MRGWAERPPRAAMAARAHGGPIGARLAPWTPAWRTKRERHTLNRLLEVRGGRRKSVHPTSSRAPRRARARGGPTAATPPTPPTHHVVGRPLHHGALLGRVAKERREWRVEGAAPADAPLFAAPGAPSRRHARRL